MSNLRSSLRRLAMVAVIAGSVVTVGSGVAGATADSTARPVHHARGQAASRLCQLENRRVATFERRQSHYAAGTAYLTGLEQKAEKAGDTHLAAYWAQVVKHREAYSTRNAARLQARIKKDAKRHSVSAGKCR